ncbi:MAG: Lrp/AsnC family transcriptional regulator [Pseudomonadota bacterium]
MALEEKEREILEKLQRDARASNAQLAEQVSMSESSCWRKVRSMEDVGIIQRYAAIVDPKKMGLHFEAVVQINLDRHNEEAVNALVELLQQCDEVIDCLAITGDFDYLLRVICKDIDAYNDFIEQNLFSNRGIGSMKTNVVLKRIKADAPVLAKG